METAIETIESDDTTRTSTQMTSSLKTYGRHQNKSSGLSTKLEILQDFDEITEEDLSNAQELLNEKETNENEVAKDGADTGSADNSVVVEEAIVCDLPVKLPPDITVVKEVPSVPQTPVKRGRGRPRKNPLVSTPPAIVPTPPQFTPPAASNSENAYPCSLCPRTFNTPFGRKIHESACRRHKSEPLDEPPEEEIAPTPSPEEVVVKRRRGRPPKNPKPAPIIEPQYKCDLCTRMFNTLAGCRRHEATCKQSTGPTGNDPDGYQPNIPIYNKQLNNLNQTLDGSLTGEQMDDQQVDVKDPYIFEEGRCHCCGEDIETAHMGGEFECGDCKKLFRLKSSLERHRRVIHNEGDTFQCPECDARCPDKGTLARHMYTHTGLKPVSCPVCKTEFSRKYHLVRHNYQTGCDGSKRPNFPCQVCGRVFNRKDNLREHLRAHAGQTKRKKKYTCELCNKEFLGTSLLNLHKRTHMVGVPDDDTSLPGSGQNNAIVKTLQVESMQVAKVWFAANDLAMNYGDKPFGCDFCPKRFPSNGALKKHRRKHTGERPYECTFCFARFAAKETLNRHLRTHTGIKPHTCQYCGKGFIQASQLRAHVFHHSGEGGFTCDQCGKSFNRRQRLQLHIKYVHEGAEPYKCDNCTRTFLRKEDLARHQLLHSGVKDHKCPICEKCFAMKSSLKIHLLTHTKEPPRSCDECGRAFIRQDCLLRHMRTKHRDMLEEIMAEAEKKKLQQQLLAAANQAALELPSEEPHVLNETSLADSIRELLTLLVDETTLKAFGWPDSSVDKLLEAVIRRCGHQPAGFPDMAYADRLRENAKLLFTVVIDDSAVKTLLNNQTVDEVILHVLRLAKS